MDAEHQDEESDPPTGSNHDAEEDEVEEEEEDNGGAEADGPEETRQPSEAPKKELVALEPESDDDEEKTSQASTAPASRRRSAKGRSWKPERIVQKETRKFHASLVKALSEERKYTDLTDIPKTDGLQGPLSETLYRSMRIVHNSPVAQAPKPPLAGRRLRHAMTWDKTDVGPDPDRPLCPHKTCRLMANDSHMQNFLHECGQRHLCGNQWEASHRRYFWHPPNPMLDQITGETGWQAENQRSVCLPDFSAAPYQNTVPLVSNCPRAGFRRQGGTTGAIQMRDARKKDRKKDTVSVAITGIERMWTEKEFLEFVKIHTGAFIFGVQIERAFGYTTGTGFIQFGSYEDAQKLIKALDGKSCGPYVLKVRYHEGETVKRLSRQPPKRPNEAEKNTDAARAAKMHSDVAAVLAYNRMIRSCGPYCEDAAAVVDRMRIEGHKPDANTYTLLIKSYGAHDPPKAAKAEAVLERMLDDNVSAAACNMAIDAWCRAGNMKRAEDIVRRMELSSGFARANPDGSEARRYAVPNHETYDVLTNGWQRCGLMEEVGELKQGHFFPKKNFPRDHLERPQTVFNSGCASAEAPSLVASWARRRSGFVPLHSGCMVPERPPGDTSSGLFVATKWRPLC